MFGPSKAAAQMEGSKAFAKDVMWDAKAPSARFRRHDNLDDALRCLEMQDTFPLVVKADGLAAGKGVVIANDFDEARAAVEANLVQRQFGTASDEIIIEEYMAGAEVSLLALCDGTTVVPMEPAQDYKRIFAGDQGPNTGGMGSYCPVPGFTEAVSQHVVEKIFEPVLRVLAARGIHYRGVLYGGLIATEAGIKVLEFNCRFGDPETQAILPRLQSDLLEVCLATARGELAGARAGVEAAGLRLRGHGIGRLPGQQPQGRRDPRPGAGGRRAGRGRLSRRHRVRRTGRRRLSIRSGGTVRAVVTNGGRVLAVSALADGFAAARERAYQRPRAHQLQRHAGPSGHRGACRARRAGRAEPVPARLARLKGAAGTEGRMTRRRSGEPRRGAATRPAARPRTKGGTSVEKTATEVEALLQGIAINPVLVGVIMGSESDREVMEAATRELDERRIGYETHVLSAHRTPDKVADYARGAQARGLKVIIAGAGKAAALPGRHRLLHQSAGHRRADQDERPRRPRFAAEHRPDAARRAGGLHGHQRRPQRRHLRRQDPGRLMPAAGPDPGRRPPAGRPPRRPPDPRTISRLLYIAVARDRRCC